MNFGNKYNICLTEKINIEIDNLSCMYNILQIELVFLIFSISKQKNGSTTITYVKLHQKLLKFNVDFLSFIFGSIYYNDG